MPEYLAPGVYVEETSFRAKSIEGVSTSTTGFVGMTRKGPYYVPGVQEHSPELLTSFGDFERIYGGLDDLDGAPNYLAHAVRAYFDNGGRRLFVSRVFQPRSDADPGLARSLAILGNGDATQRVRFAARFPGSAGNGTITVRQVAAPATLRSIDAAPTGSLLRVGGRQPQLPARLVGGHAPFALSDGGQLLLTVAGADVAVTVHGEPAVATGADALPDPITIPEADATLQLVVDGVPQQIALPTTETSLAALLAAINEGIRDGSAALTGADDAPADRLVIRSDRRGSDAQVTVRANATLGFAADVVVSGADDATNNVRDLFNVTAEDLNARFDAEGVAVHATVDAATGNLVLTSTATGDTATITVRGGAGAQNTALGLLTGQTAQGQSGTPLQYYVKAPTGWQDAAAQPLDRSPWQATGAPDAGADLLTLSVAVTDADGHTLSFDEMGFDPAHPRFVGDVLSMTPARRADALEQLFGIEVGRNVTALALRAALFPDGQDTAFALQNGNDGLAATVEAYRTALLAFEAIDDISIVAAPDAAANASILQGVHAELITHVERRGAYRIAVLDTPEGITPTESLQVRGFMDSSHAALYYPWVDIANPLARPGDASVPEEIAVPPSGFVCGIYARSDNEYGVFKAPANEVVLGALRLERDINFGQQELLNPRGVNCIRFFPNRGYRVWGARTASSDPEWKYVNIRRYFNYLERSIEQGTQWVVFEPNGERLWANVRETISTFLYNEWVSGALLGETAKEAFFVKCDRSTMTQNDLDNGRLICLVGVAAVKPAEFVIFRIGQKTADNRS